MNKTDKKQEIRSVLLLIANYFAMVIGGATFRIPLISITLLSICSIISIICINRMCENKKLKVTITVLPITVCSILYVIYLTFVFDRLKNDGDVYRNTYFNQDLFGGLSFVLVFLLFLITIGNTIVMFTNKVSCSICNKKMLRIKGIQLSRKKDGCIIWQCIECKRRYRNEYLDIDKETGVVTVIPMKQRERRIKCNTCGYIYCFDDNDLKKNNANMAWSLVNTGISIIDTLNGHYTSAQISGIQADMDRNKIVDYTRCLRCHSSDVRHITEEEYHEESKRSNNPLPQSSNSVADELKKFKELYDLGAITSEEYESKKKQLLNI